VGACVSAARVRTAPEGRLLTRVGVVLTAVRWIPRAREPKGKALCEAVTAPGSAISPLAVLPRKRCPTEIPLSRLGIPAVTFRAGRVARIVRLLKW
jgi:hypothetical protein